ncbi:MAG: zinc-ribbon domain-containing protein [Promethearchaeota archaeon]
MSSSQPTFPLLPIPLGLLIVLAGIIFVIIFLIITTLIIYWHRRHLKAIAAEKGRTLTFKEGSETYWALECIFALVTIIVTVLIGLGVIPLELLMQELNPNNIGFVTLTAACLFVFFPIVLIIALIVTIRLQRQALQDVLRTKPRAPRKPTPKIRCPSCGKTIPRNWDYCDACGAKIPA